MGLGLERVDAESLVKVRRDAVCWTRRTDWLPSSTRQPKCITTYEWIVVYLVLLARL